MVQLWDYHGEFDKETDIVGYHVEAMDGGIGKVDEATYDAESSYIVVDTGPWIFGKKVLLPAGVVTGVDHDEKVVSVDRTKDEIKNAPRFEEGGANDASFRESLGDYYGDAAAGL